MTAWDGPALGVGWAVVVLGLAWGRRPRPARSLAGPRSALGGRSGPVSGLGAGLLRLAGRPHEAARARAVGGAALVSPALLLLSPVLVPLPWVLVALAPRYQARKAGRREAGAWSEAVPEAVDLFALALAGGLSVPGALGLVASRAPPPLGPALVRADLRFRHGEALDVALSRVSARAPEARALLSVLVAAHCDGVPAAEPLARLADELRERRRREGEARARQVPVRMLFPLVGCTLPAFVLVTVVPAVVTALGDLSL